jgi:hypothetical protein
LKRIFLLVLALLAFAIPAHAMKLKSQQLMWHTAVDVANGIPYRNGDSLYVTRDGSTVSNADDVDTTSTFSLREWEMPGPPYSTITLSDSLSYLKVDIYPVGSSPTVTADSIGVRLQVSQNPEQGWVNTVFTGPKISPLVTLMNGLAVLESGTSNCFTFTIRQVVGGATQSIFDWVGTGAPTANQVYGYRYGRFIVTGDHAGKYAVEITGFVPDNVQTPPN